MSAILLDNDDTEYLTWGRSHPTGSVINTFRNRDPGYMVLHRANCRTITKNSGNAAPGGFTERDFIKICALDIGYLQEWARQNDRPDGSFSSECNHCDPSYNWEEDNDDGDWLG